MRAGLTIETLSASELLEVVSAEVASWSPQARRTHGFGLLAPDEQTAHEGRRAQARTLLSAQSTLERLGAAGDGPLVLMKGLEVAQLYPTPLHRPFRDIDILVSDGRRTWDALVKAGHQPAGQRLDLDHHHLPPLASPSGVLGVDVHVRPNLPGWARLDAQVLLATSQASRTGIEGVHRPRDDLHALLLALHCWKGGFARRRDLLDALLLGASSDIPVSTTAAQLGLAAFWRWTVRFSEALLLGAGDGTTRRLLRASGADRAEGARRARLLAPLLVTGPAVVARGHLKDYRHRRSARRLPTGRA